jgi:predicted permease
MPIVRRLWYLLNRRRLQRDLAREMAAHRAMMAEPSRFGSMLRLREESADAWGWTWLDDLGRDLAYGVRQLKNAPRFTIAALSLLTLGAGVALSLLHVANAARFYLYAVPDADRLVRVTRQSPEIISTFPWVAVTLYRAHGTTFSYLVSESLGTRVSTDDDPAPLAAAFVSGNYFRDLKVVAAAGRLPGDGDARPEAAPAAALGHSYWRRHFASDPGVVGRMLRVNGTPVHVIGVLPVDFDGLGPPRRTEIDIWMPMAVRPRVIERSRPLDDVTRSDSAIYGTLAAGVTFEAAAAQLQTLTQQLRREQPQIRDREPVEVVSLIRPARFEADVAVLYVLFFLIFFSACANLGNMLLARGLARRREVDIRFALGASRRRVVRQLVTENLLLAVLGCATGTVAGYAGANLLLRVFSYVPAGAHIVLDQRMLIASMTMIVVAMLGFGMAPIVDAMRRRKTSPRARHVLVAVQVTSSAVLLILGTLLARGDQRMRAVDLSFDYARTVVVDPHFTARTLSPDEQSAMLSDMTARLARLPGVDGVSLMVTGPLMTGMPALSQQVAPSYFTLLGLSVIRGRTFLDREPNVVMVSESAARAMWPDRDALGQIWSGPGGSRFEVVGIVKDSGLSVRRGSTPGEAYFPVPAANLSRSALLVHTNGDPHRLLRDARAAAAPAGVTPSATTMADTLDLPQQSMANVIGLLGSLATLLAFTGVFGLVSFAVAQRTREIGVRVALGARRIDILRMVLAHQARPLAYGSLAGIGLAIAASQTLRSQLHGLAPLDPISFGAGVAGVAAVALAAMLLPARRALRIDPASVLRWE